MPTPETFDRVIADAVARRWPEATPRRMRLPAVPGKADAVIGPRRAGKTYLLFSHARELERAGLPRERILYLNFEDERLGELALEDLHRFIDAWERRLPEVATGERWVLLDEVQVVPGWERFVRRLLDTPGNRVVVTGSSAKLLSQEIATAMRGRALTTEVLPFSFAEALAHAGVKVDDRWPRPSPDAARLRHALDRYLLVGGYPEVQGMADDLRARVLRDYMDVALLRDVVERHGVGNVAALRSLVRRLLGTPAGKFSVHRFHNDLQSSGLAVSKDSLHQWVGHLEDAGVVHFVPIHTDSEAVRRSNPRKCYPVDPALSPGSGNLGARLETVVYLELRRRGYEVAWLANPDGTDVDFIATRGERTLLVQACLTMGEPATRDRELAALATAMGTHGDAEAQVVTLDAPESVRVATGQVAVRTATEWLLRPDPA